jgi:hypothetical protein
VLERRSKLSPGETKAVLQMTSSFMPEEGLMASGAGSLNVLAAAEFVSDGRRAQLPETLIAGHEVSASGVAFTTRVFAQQRSGFVGSTSIFWGTTKPQSIFWGTTNSDDSIFWGTNSDDSIFWGTAKPQSIFWGTNSNDSIFWGTNSSDSIFWGTNSSDSIFWGTNSGDSIFWGTNLDDSIFWGTGYLD